jgi:hypothetical protein
MDVTGQRLVDWWRSQPALARAGIVFLVVAAIEVIGVAIYSFLLPVTG